MIEIIEKEIINRKVLDNNKAILQKEKLTYDFGYEDNNKKIILPTLTDKELLERYKTIRPIVSYQELYYFLKEFDLNMLRNMSYINNLARNISERIDITKEDIIDEFFCYHTNYGSFKPTIAEILQQFPDNLLNDANAFYMSDSPITIKESNKRFGNISEGYHKSTIKVLSLKRK